MKTTSLLLLVVLFLTGCSNISFYQLYKAVPENGVVVESSILFEDSLSKISYNLWRKGGDAGFLFYNKSDSDIIIQVDHSFFVLNDVAHDYYQNRSFNKTTSVGTMSTYSPNYPYSIAASGSAIASGRTVTYVEPTQIIVPPKTSKRISEYLITETFLSSCDQYKYPTRKKIKTLSYSKETSPFVFSNVITYKSQGMEKRLIHKFFVTEISNIPESEFFGFENEVVCGKKTLKDIRVYKHVSPSSFFLIYKKEPNGSTEEH